MTATDEAPSGRRRRERSTMLLWVLGALVAVAVVVGAVVRGLRGPAALDPDSPEGASRDIGVILWRVVRRRLVDDANERASAAWSLHLAIAATVSLIIAYVNLVEVGTWALAAADLSGQTLAAAVVWGSRPVRDTARVAGCDGGGRVGLGLPPAGAR